MNGYHSIWRSEREWAGLSPDYVIESVLMRSLKTSGGLTRGRGMLEQQRAILTLSMPACASLNSSIQELTGVHRATGEQHQELSQSRICRDWKDTFVLIQYLKDRNPFDCGEKLCNISNGVYAQASVNVDESKLIGSRIIAKMEGLQPSEHTFKKKDQAVSMASKVAVKIDGEKSNVSPQRLFQRLAIAAAAVAAESPASESAAATASSVSAASSLLPTTFTYELTTYPTALFETVDLLLEPQKSSLADEIWSMTKANSATLPEGAQVVLDGGSLLHRIVWNRGSTFESILNAYTNYVNCKYGKPVVVFDGYQGSTIKDMTHKRRSKGKHGMTVTFEKSMNLAVTKEVFLSNKENKQRFIIMLGEELSKSGCTVFHDTGDADCLIVKKAIAAAAENKVVLVGDDTDLLVLLLHQLYEGKHDVYFAPEP